MGKGGIERILGGLIGFKVATYYICIPGHSKREIRSLINDLSPSKLTKRAHAIVTLVIELTYYMPSMKYVVPRGSKTAGIYLLLGDPIQS